MKGVSSPSRANTLTGDPSTLGMALVELWMLYAAFKARDFKQNPTPKNLTEWCNAMEMVDEPYRDQTVRIAA